MNHSRIPSCRAVAVALIGLSVLAFVTGGLLELLDVSFVPDVAVRAPFWTASRFGLLLGLLLLALTRPKLDDEYLVHMRLDAMRGSLLAVVIAAIANESLYFFTDRLIIDSTSTALVLLVVYHLILGIRMRMANRSVMS